MTFQNITQLFPASFSNDSSMTKTLGEEFVLCENGNMVFHWADFFETCDLIKTQLESDPGLLKDFKKRERALQGLIDVTVWVRTEKKVHQTSMYELYEKYILNQFKSFDGIDPFSALEISFISATGPFKGMSITECFNKTTYRDFVMVFLIHGKLPRRDYRIRVNSKILMEHGKEFNKAELISLEQLSVNGFLLSMDSSTYLKHIAGQESVRLLINTKVFSEAEAMDLDALKNHLSQYTFNLLYSSSKEDSLSIKVSDIGVHSSFDFAKHKNIFLFISFDKIFETKPGKVEVISNFVQHTKGLVLDFYKDLGSQKKSA